VIDTYSLFRCNFETNGLFVRRADGSWWPREPKGGSAPPEDWTAPEFDDLSWPAMPGPFFNRGSSVRYGFNFRNGVPSSMSTICLRTRFEVTDPAAAGELKLDLSFLGGAVVYLNGQEVGRAHLPEGKIRPLTMAEGYPEEAYKTPKGGIIRNGFGDPKTYRDLLEKRIRHVRGLVLPAKLLRKGSNLLAVRIQSAPHHEVALVKGRRGKLHFYGFRSSSHRMAHWVTVGMPELRLTAGGSGVHPALNRPSGFQVYNQSPFLLAYDIDHAPAGSQLRPLRISAARGGSFSDQLVVAGDRPISGLKVSAGELKREGGEEAIPASAVRVRYPQPSMEDPGGHLRLAGANQHTRVSFFDALYARVPAKVPVRPKHLRGSRPFRPGALQPVWVTVDVPAGAAAGDYAGSLSLEAEGLDRREVPVKLRVSDWRVPPPQKWRTFVDFFQSPESVAMKYEVPMWSGEHWQHLEKSFRLLGSVGNRTVYLRLIAKTENGNSQTILRWVRQADGSLKPDFTLVDRYLALASKHLVNPDVVCLYVWDRRFGGGYFGRKAKEWRTIEVTVFDPKTGKSELAEAGNYSQDGMKAFWKPAADGILERVKKLGWTGALMLGIGDDHIPAKRVVQLWKDLLPEAGWVSMSHDIMGGYHGVQKVGYATTVWAPKWARSPAERLYGWKRKNLICHFDRDSWRAPAQDQHFSKGYLATEKNICGAQRGFGRMNGDFFKVLKPGQGDKRNRGMLTSRFGGKGHLSIKMNPFLAPGPEGPVSTVRLEVIRENLTECEARIVIESALLDKAARAKLGEEKAKEFEELLVERTRWVFTGGSTYGAYKFIASDWRGRRARLFDAAAEVRRLLED
jgi:hypothetical protein